MARRLPWKQKQSSPSPKPSAKPRPDSPVASPEQPSLPASTPPPRASPTPQRRRVHGSPGLFELLRSPSTSPPPEPPPEQPMIPSDDRYRMVEDEFLHTAQRFTTHLHRAEYNRLKARAKSQHALTIRAIERPVVGPQTATARLRDAAFKRAARQRKVLTPRRARQAADGDGDGDGDDDAPWVGTTLQGLMETPRGEARCISSSCAPATHPTTRAAAGYQQPTVAAAAARSTPRRQTQNSNASPLPPPSRRNLPATVADQATFHVDAPSRGNGVRDIVTRDRTRDSARDRRGRVDLEGRHAGGSDEDATDDDDPFSINRRRMRRAKSRAQLRKNDDRDPPRKLSPDTIPSFL
ncbi:hypothetical protein HRG_003751 [Hirsutella rhossiliensis]|uniref:Uncharacterized protein n=1 Tax=Hirsutella rhossiliensis TaxID=111463 RepID=A0A9P8SLE7_9HYPO|nr:uncharacterized protein HRG_03751 [Hirsutella rhossiliensis]KAH0965735.1 hypothetical protein HRG_03751 [Hirsutella rhossiliensis]